VTSDRDVLAARGAAHADALAGSGEAGQLLQRMELEVEMVSRNRAIDLEHARQREAALEAALEEARREGEHAIFALRGRDVHRDGELAELREGLKALNEQRPEDPLQFLADYLVAHKHLAPRM